MFCQIAIIIPTYKEAQNLPYLFENINIVMQKNKLSYEINIIDDNSNDGTKEIIQTFNGKYPVKLLVRESKKGLSSAVIAGFTMSNSEIIVVMDADLSHKPENIPELIKPIIENKADFVIGSRFIKGGSIVNFNFYRKLNAIFSKILARPLTNIKDPLSGFFALRRRTLENCQELNPLGYKIALEILVKAKPKKTVEIPITLQKRLYGKSKLSWQEQLNYLIQILRLMKFKFIK